MMSYSAFSSIKMMRSYRMLPSTKMTRSCNMLLSVEMMRSHSILEYEIRRTHRIILSFEMTKSHNVFKCTRCQGPVVYYSSVRDVEVQLDIPTSQQHTQQMSSHHNQELNNVVNNIQIIISNIWVYLGLAQLSIQYRRLISSL